jgi:DNA-directed RNA polymerase specialized sigma24 family protein
VENLTAREIASALSRKQETVRKQIVRGKKMLIHYLRKEGMEND